MARGSIKLTLGMLADLLGLPEDMTIHAVRAVDVADGPVELLVECPRLPERDNLFGEPPRRRFPYDERPAPWPVYPQWQRHFGEACDRPHIHLELMIPGRESGNPLDVTLYPLGEPAEAQ